MDSPKETITYAEESNSSTPPAPTDPENNYHGIHTSTILVYLSINLIYFAQLLNLVGAGAYATDVAASIGGAEKTSWLSQSIVISIAVLSPSVSQASDYWGRKWIIVVLTAINTVGSIVTSRSSTMGIAILGQVISGVGSGCTPLLYAVPSEILPRRYRAAAQAGINVGIALACIMGLLVGAVLVKASPDGWRIYWYIVAAFNGVSAILCAVFYKPPPRPYQRSLTLKQKLGQLDWVGNGLLAVGLILFSMALTWSDNPFSWTNAHILAPFILGGISLVGLGIHQYHFKKDGLFNHSLFKKDRNMAISLLLIFVEGLCFFAANNFFPFQVAVLFASDPLQVGLRYSVAFYAMIASCVGIAIWSSITKTIRIPAVLAYLSFTIFNVLMATATLSSSTAMWGYPIFVGLGLGICLTCIVTAAQLSAPPELIAITSGLLICIRSFGASVGIAIFTAMLNSKLTANIGPDIAAQVLPLGLAEADLPQFIAALTSRNQKLLMSIPGVTLQVIQAGGHGLQLAYLGSFRYVWIIAASLSFVGLIGAAFLINPKKDFTMHVDAPLEEEEPQPAMKVAAA